MLSGTRQRFNPIHLMFRDGGGISRPTSLKARAMVARTTSSSCRRSVFRSPLHIAAIPNMGLTLGEIFFLEELAADCAQDRRWEFLLVAPPLPVTAAMGTPINPYAIK